MLTYGRHNVTGVHSTHFDASITFKGLASRPIIPCPLASYLGYA